MDLNYKTVNLFPVPIHIFDVNGFVEIQNQIIEYVYDCKSKNSIGKKVSNRGGWQSECFSLVDESDLLQSFLINCLASFPAIKKSVDLIVTSWININSPGSFNVKHTHPTSDLSGVIWIKCPKKCGNIIFDSPTSFVTYNEIQCCTDEFKESHKYYHNYRFSPIEGRMLIFPSHLTHQVEINESKEDRISVSFNIRLKNG